MEKNRPKVAVVIFVISDNKILFGKRKNTSGDGYWGLPGGHLEFGESLLEGAKRELLEETGLRANDIKFAHLINDPNIENNTHYLHIDFIIEKFEGEPTVTEPDKCYELKWFGFDELPEDIFIGHKKSLKAFFEKTVIVD